MEKKGRMTITLIDNLKKNKKNEKKTYQGVDTLAGNAVY